MRSKRFLLAVGALATVMVAADAGAQTIAYRNLLQFDLQSFRSQATGGIFHDDVDQIADATRLLEVDGTRIFTNFSNLSDPATIGDNLITYSYDRVANFAAQGTMPDVYSGAPDTFDAGSYLGGWIGKYKRDSDYTFEVVYQRSGHKAMFEDLEDGSLGTNTGFSTDAEFTQNTLTQYDDGTGPDTGGDGDFDREQELNADLKRYDDRSATRFDFGVARELTGTDWSVGGRVFWQNDEIERNAEGTVETINRQKVLADTVNLVETGRTMTTYSGSMDTAFKMREAGVSLNGDWHPGGWSLNTRLDVFSINQTNPSSDLSGPFRGGDSSLPWFMSGESPNIYETTTSTVVTTPTGFNPNTMGSLTQDRVNSSTNTGAFGLGNYQYGYVINRGINVAVESVDDERTGLGFAGKVEMDRPAWGGDTRTWIGMNYSPVDIDATITLAGRQTSQFWWNDSTQSTGDVQAMLTNLDEMQTLSWTGDAKNTVLEAGGKWWRALSNRVEMGLGLTVTRSKYKQDYNEVAEDTSTMRFDDGFGTLGGNELDTFQGGFGAYNEEQTVVHTMFSTDFTDEIKTTDIRLPVGAQFNITKKIKWQMGVQHKIEYMTRETTASRGSGNDETGVEITTYTDYANSANDTVTYDTFSHISGDETITDKDKYNQTTYWYGLEWLVGDTAQFNINGFFDSHGHYDYPDPQFDGGSGKEIWDVDFFRNLAVSLTFLFD